MNDSGVVLADRRVCIKPANNQAESRLRLKAAGPPGAFYKTPRQPIAKGYQPFGAGWRALVHRTRPIGGREGAPELFER